jgi:hypothetical protein
MRICVALLLLLPSAALAAPVPPPKERRAATAAVKVEPGTVLELKELRDSPLPEVFKWLAEQTGKEIVCTFKPTGTFTLPGARQRCGVAEFIDLLNLELARRDLHIIRRERCFVLVAVGD